MSKTVAVTDVDLATLIDEIAKTHEEIVITKDGTPVVRLVPATERRIVTLEDLRQSGKVLGDIEEPILGEWDTAKW
jgi:prevent-host-death family protein